MTKATISALFGIALALTCAGYVVIQVWPLVQIIHGDITR